MQDLSRNGSPEFDLTQPDGYGARRRATLALDLANPCEKRSRIASLSDLALNELTFPTSGQSEDPEKSALLTPTPTQFLFPKNVTEEQAAYAHGFERALEEIYKEKGVPLTLAAHNKDRGPSDDGGKAVHCGVISINTSSTAPQSTVPLMSRGQFSQYVSQSAPFGDLSISSSISTCNSISSGLNFSASTRGLETRTVQAQAPAGASGNGSFIPGGKVIHHSVPMTFGPILHGDLRSTQVPSSNNFNQASQVQFITGQPTLTSTNKNWSAMGEKLRSTDVANPQIQFQTGSVSSNPPLVGSVLPIHSQVGTNPSIGLSNPIPVLAHTQTGNAFPNFSPFRTTVDFRGVTPSRTFNPQLNATSNACSIYQTTSAGMLASESCGLSSATELASSGAWTPVKCEMAPVSAVNMDEQERLKLERKRAKNRVAAQRCQMRKLERISRLEDKAEKLREQNLKLLQTVDALRGHIAQLKKQITAHADRGCRLLLPDVPISANPIVSTV